MKVKTRAQHPLMRCDTAHNFKVIPVIAVVLVFVMFAIPGIRPPKQPSHDLSQQRSTNVSEETQRERVNDLPPPSRLPDRGGWFSKSPSVCKALLREPIPLEEGCSSRDEDGLCRNGKAMMFSQYRQDWYIYTKHFSRLRRRGIYLDVATNEPVRISNTYFMDACLGWQGLCVEANKRYHIRIRAKRSCALLPTCVSDTDGQKVQFYDALGLSGIEETNNNKGRWKSRGQQFEKTELTCTTMARTLQTFGVTRVDYMSMDVEGHEMFVLKGFNWNETIINVMTVEAKGKSKQQIEDFLREKGYKRHVVESIKGTGNNGRLHLDMVFLHRDVVFGQPE